MSCEHLLRLIDVVQAAEGHEGSKVEFLIKMGWGIIHTDWETLYYLLTDTTILNDIYQSEEKILFMAKLEGENILEILFLTLLVKQVVYIDKFKLFDPRVVRVKKFEFAWVNHSESPCDLFLSIMFPL